MAERIPEANNADYTRQVLSNIFENPSGYREDFNLRDIYLGETEPTGAASVKIIDSELRALGINPRLSRKAASEATRTLLNNETPWLLSDKPMLRIIHSQGVFRRSDISERMAADRALAYEQILREKAEEYRIKEEERKKESEGPSKATLWLIAPFTKEDYASSIKILREEVPKNVKVEPNELDIVEPVEAAGAVVYSRDIRTIIENGISPEQFPDLIEHTRKSIVEWLTKNEGNAVDIANCLLNQTTDRLKQPGQKFELHSFALRDMANLVFHALRNLNEDPNIEFTLAMATYAGVFVEPLPRKLLNLWASRFDAKTLEKFTEEFNKKDPKLGDAIQTILLGDSVEKDCAALWRGDEITVDNVTVQKDAVDNVLVPLLFNDDLIAQAIFADVLGQMHPYIFTLRSAKREVGLHSLRYLAEHFNANEISSLLTPKKAEPKNLSDIERLRKQMETSNQAIATLTTTDKQTQQKKKSLEQTRVQLAKRLKKFEERNSAQIPIRTLIEIALSKKVKEKEPRAQDNPLGEKDPEFTEDFNLYQAYMFVTNDKKTVLKGSNTSTDTAQIFKEKVLVFSLLPEGALKL